ncbi:unnamed protein product, partial [Didymodactylos carnosus]
RCAQKAADFTAFDLAHYIDQCFYTMTKTVKNDESALIRSAASCRLDLRRWGAKEDNYYVATEDENPTWMIPTQSSPCVLLFHDESTFRSDDIANKRWFFGDEAPFHSKGRGRNNMVSGYLVQHPSGPIFSLNEKGYTNAIRKYPQLGIDYAK